MAYVAIDPPGTWCNNQALRDVLAGLPVKPRRFVDIGCGAGPVSKLLLAQGMQGTALDYSAQAVAICRENLRDAVASGALAVIEADVLHNADGLPNDHDCAVCYMVLEHIEDDAGFARQCARLVRPGGHAIFTVPGRSDQWTLEDETVGHLRRYDRPQLKAVLEQAGLEDVRVISIAVPVANLLLRLGDAMIRRSGEVQKKDALSDDEQTRLSGIREIPWKTVFPSWVRLILNPVSLYPLFVIQRLFYDTDMGVALMGYGRVPAAR